MVLPIRDGDQCLNRPFVLLFVLVLVLQWLHFSCPFMTWNMPRNYISFHQIYSFRYCRKSIVVIICFQAREVNLGIYNLY